jgi:maleylacetoacetate isomerase
MELYSFFRSSASYRVRIGLNLKRIPYDTHGVNLTKDGGENRKLTYLVVNPQGKVPALKLEDGRVLTQSMAILEYLDETMPHPPFLPRDPFERAQVRSVANIIACDIHPLNNLAVQNHIRDEFGADPEGLERWCQHWITEGFRAIESLIPGGEAFCFGEQPTLADILLVPQVFNARRVKTDLSAFPKIVAVDKRARELDAFAKAHPLVQPDTPPELASPRPQV